MRETDGRGLLGSSPHGDVGTWGPRGSFEGETHRTPGSAAGCKKPAVLEERTRGSVHASAWFRPLASAAVGEEPTVAGRVERSRVFGPVTGPRRRRQLACGLSGLSTRASPSGGAGLASAGLARPSGLGGGCDGGRASETCRWRGAGDPIASSLCTDGGREAAVLTGDSVAAVVHGVKPKVRRRKWVVWCLVLLVRDTALPPQVLTVPPA